MGGKWTYEEDENLRRIVSEQGPKNWRLIADALGSTRTDVQCLHRWNKVLRPGLQKGGWTPKEDEILRELVSKEGAHNVKWAAVAQMVGNPRIMVPTDHTV